MSDTSFSADPRARRDGGSATGRADAPLVSQAPSVAERDIPATACPTLAGGHAQLSFVSASCGIVLHVHSDLGEVAEEWKKFERRAARTAFQTFDWLAKWQHHIGALSQTVPVIVLGRASDGELLFILQLGIETYGGFRRLRWLGSRLCDYNAPLLGERFRDHVGAENFVRLWDEIVSQFRASPHFRFDVIDLQKMPETVGAQRNPFLELPLFVHPSGAYVATLGDDWETYYAAKRSSSTRKRERRQLKQLAEHGEVRFVDVQDREAIAQTMSTLIAQKSDLFERMGVTNIFALPGYREFYLDVATDPSARELTHVSRLDVGADIAAASLGLKLNDYYYLILSSYQNGALTRFGPGRAHLNELLRHAIGRGFRCFDFTVGDEPYKRDWCDIEVRLFDHLAAASMRGWPAATVMSAFRRLKRFIKQTPLLWRVFSKARVVGRRLKTSVWPR